MWTNSHTPFFYPPNWFKVTVTQGNVSGNIRRFKTRALTHPGCLKEVGEKEFLLILGSNILSVFWLWTTASSFQFGLTASLLPWGPAWGSRKKENVMFQVSRNQIVIKLVVRLWEKRKNVASLSLLYIPWLLLSKEKIWTIKIPQLIKTLATKSDDLTSVPGTRKAGGKLLPQAVLWPIHTLK